ncbi:MAG: hypothetical protein GC168_20440, partial [Candidatus Hydrogenedens sp.]|nr:hypothetical protein [Candidatus Hydrogenedens sp.]
MSFVYFDGTDMHELDSVSVRTEKDEWYTLNIGLLGGAIAGVPNLFLTLNRTSDSAGEPMALLLELPGPELPDIDGDVIGFTQGEESDYQFQLKNYTFAYDISDNCTTWSYDAFGRKIRERKFDLYLTTEDKTVADTLYQWDGWRLVAEVDAVSGHVLADYVPGPGYVDDIVAARRDLDDNNSFAASESFYYLTDQQFSTVALLNASGALAERYDYDPFGTPSIYDASGSAIGATAVGNNHLYTGREYLPTLGLYDYRQRYYDPAAGRFLATDPVHDPNNLGNPYTYVANN